MSWKSIIFAILLFLATICAHAQTDDLLWNPNPIKKKLQFTLDNSYNFGFGIEAEGFYNYSPGLLLMWRGGSHRQLLNLTAGAELLYQNPVRTNRRYHTISFGQFAPYAGLRINFFRHPSGSLYAEGDVSYNLNFEAKYHTHFSTQSQIIKKDTSRDSVLVRNHWGSTFKVGFIAESVDFGLYAKYDFKPSLNQKFIYEEPVYDYYSMGPAINERWCLGLYCIIYFRL